jgi:predicted metal-dependent peptidase
MNIIEIDAPTKRKWIETRSALLWSCPAFTHILFTMLNPSKGELAALFTDEVPIAATDGENLILNPATFFKYTLSERVFIVAHEILHCIYNHCILSRPYRQSGNVKFADGTSLPYDAMTMNVAMDLVINDALIKSGVGSFPKEGCHDVSLATADDSFLDAYKKVFKQQKNGGKGPSGGFDVILEPGAGSGKDPGKAQQGRSQAEWDTAVAGAIATAKSQGKLPAALERLLGEVLDPVIPWQEHIRSFFARKVGNSAYNWRKPDKRMIQRDIFTPARSGYGCGDVIVAVDTSGSIGQKEIDTFFGEVRGILEDVKPMKLWLVWCDAQVHRVDELDSGADLAGLKPVGGGGTDFRPVFDWAEQSNVRADAIVYFTDMMGTFPDHAPETPVIWADIYNRIKAPFGETIAIPIRK